MKQYDLFDKPLNGLYALTTVGGIRMAFASLLSVGSILCIVIATAISVFCAKSYSTTLERTAITVNPFISDRVIFSVDIVIINKACEGIHVCSWLIVDLSYHFDDSQGHSPVSVNVWMRTARVNDRSEWRMFRLPLLVVTFLVLRPFSPFMHFGTVTSRERVTSTSWTSRRATPSMANTAICQTNEVNPFPIESAVCDGALHLRPGICLMVWD